MKAGCHSELHVPALQTGPTQVPIPDPCQNRHRVRLNRPLDALRSARDELQSATLALFAPSVFPPPIHLYRRKAEGKWSLNYVSTLDRPWLESEHSHPIPAFHGGALVGICPPTTSGAWREPLPMSQRSQVSRLYRIYPHPAIWVRLVAAHHQ